MSFKQLGYESRKNGAPLASLAPGYIALSASQAPEFPAGVMQVKGQTVGVLKIGLFSPQGAPELCEAALKGLQIPRDKPCDDACADKIETWTSDQLTLHLAAQLNALHSAGAQVLVVDITGNGGGSAPA